MLENFAKNAFIWLAFMIIIISADTGNKNDKSTFVVGNIIPRENHKLSFLRAGIDSGKPLPPPCRGQKRLECSGCNAIVACDTIGKRPNHCGSSTPYCVEQSGDFDTCSAAPGSNTACANEGTNSFFSCTGPGYFPDPGNCRAYHICGGAFPEPATDLACPSTHFYDIRTKACRVQVFAKSCETFDCTSENVGVRPLRAFGRDKQFFIFCRADTIGGRAVYVPMIYKCPDFTKFNGRICEFRCSGIGRFVHSENPYKYFECLRIDDRLKAEEYTCPTGLVFNAQQRLCVLIAVTVMTTEKPDINASIDSMESIDHGIATNSSNESCESGC